MTAPRPVSQGYLHPAVHAAATRTVGSNGWIQHKSMSGERSAPAQCTLEHTLHTFKRQYYYEP